MRIEIIRMRVLDDIATPFARTRLTLEMIPTDDIFARDAINLELDRKATEFSINRQKLFELGLSENELQRFAEIDQAVRPALK